jgi:hypothetical protein
LSYFPMANRVAAGLALLLFAVMSLVVLRGAAAPAASVTPAPAVTPAVSASGAENVTPEPQGGAANSSEPPDATAMAGLWLSAISAITALLGLVSSLWLGWRKEQREVAQHRLELERTRLEVEKLRRDLGQLS